MSSVRRSLADHYHDIRNRILSSQRFQRWAAGFPLTRPIAARRTVALFDYCAGFVYTQILLVTVRVRLLEALATEPRTVAELAPVISLPLEATQRLVDAATSLRLLESRGRGRYGLGVHGASLLGNPSVALMVEHNALLYRDLVDPVAVLRGELGRGELQAFWSYAGTGRNDAEGAAAYSRLMAESFALIADDILDAYPHHGHRTLLDIGGGEGAFLEAAAARAPDLSLLLFELPHVASRARERLERAGLAQRAGVIPGDIFRDPLPVGADLASLIRVIHDHDEVQALRILVAVRKSLAPGGVLLLAEPMSGTRGAEPMGDAYFGLYLLAMGQGRPRREAELRELLLRAGFQSVRARPTRRPMLARLLVARAP